MQHAFDSFMTAHLVLRRFRLDDGPGIQRIAIDKKASDGSRYHHPWPTSDEGCKMMAEYLSGNDRFWAACLIENQKLIGLIALNSLAEHKRLDLGHVFHRRYTGGDYDFEAIECLVDHAFSSLDIQSIFTHIAPAWTVQTAPLKKLGFLSRSGGPLEMTREDWFLRSK